MAKILIITDVYYPKPLANGICVHAIGVDLKNQGNEVHVMSFNVDGGPKNLKYDGVYIHRVKPRFFYKMRTYGEANIKKLRGKFIYNLAMVTNKVKRLIFYRIHPITSPLFVKRFNKEVANLHKQYEFDIIISTYNPIEACIAGMNLKNKNSDTKFVLYNLDSLTNGVSNTYMSKQSLLTKGWNWEQKLYSAADMILNLKCHEIHHDHVRYNRFRNKMYIVDIPLYLEKKIDVNKTTNAFKKEYINFVYTGALDLNFRNPEYLLNVFIKMKDKQRYKLHFFSRGNAEKMLEEYELKSDNLIVSHGYVEHEESLRSIYSSDILISIGNNNSDMIPSKTFEYISTGKKIIHFYKSDTDSSIYYYNKYPFALLISEMDSIEINIEKIMEFITEKTKEDIIKNIDILYCENKPEYTTKIIGGLIE